MIKYSIRGENIEVTEALRDYVESKLSKVEKYFHEDQELHARVNLKVYREKTAKVEVTIPTGSVTLRAEDVSLDMYGSIDLVVDKIARQIRKNKTKIARKYREKVPTGEMFRKRNGFAQYVVMYTKVMRLLSSALNVNNRKANLRN